MPTVDPVMVQRRCAILGTRSIKKQAKVAGLTLALAMIDLTTLEGKDSPGKVRSLCRKAARPFERDEEVLGTRLPPVAAVCVYPSMIKPVVDELERAQPDGRTVKVASVATGFPSGQYRAARRRRRDRHGHRPGRFPVRSLSAGLRRDRGRQVSLRAVRRHLGPPQGHPGNRRARDPGQ
jgi:hypothetical protein